MIRIIVLFNLKAGTDVQAYEAWAADTDSPTVNGLASVSRFKVYRATGLLGSDAPSPYDYIEVLDIQGMDELIEDVSSDAMRAISAQFQEFADNPQFIVTEQFA